MNEQYDLIVIGGGASGMAAAIFAARLYPAWRVAVLEKQARVGRKLLATGNGTCNIANIHADVSHYHGGTPAFVIPALTQFTPQDTAHFFESVGVPCAVRENGRMYPVCESAAAVLDCLRLELSRRGVTVLCEQAVRGITRRGDMFEIAAADTFAARRVLLAAGGAASPALGGGNDGYALAAALSHTRTSLSPSIVQVKTDTTYVKAVKGLRLDGTVTLEQDGRALASETGEILFTEYGLSGPAVMQVSRGVGENEQKTVKNMRIRLDCFPSISEEILREKLYKRAQTLGKTWDDFLTGLFQRRIGQTLVRASGVGALTDAVDPARMATLAHTIKHWTFDVTGTQGWGGAQVTAGGLDTTEFDAVTLQSRKVKNLYACGEVLDVDGDCGGYNLQWAWASAYAAVQAMGREAEQ